MELEAIVNQILPTQTGTTARGNWSSQDVIFEIPAEFNNKVCVTFRNDKIGEISALKIGDRVKVSFNVSSREWNSKWYTSLNGWKVDRSVTVSSDSYSADAPSAQPPLEAYSTEQSSEESTDLPF